MRPSSINSVRKEVSQHRVGRGNKQQQAPTQQYSTIPYFPPLLRSSLLSVGASAGFTEKRDGRAYRTLHRRPRTELAHHFRNYCAEQNIGAFPLPSSPTRLLSESSIPLCYSSLRVPSSVYFLSMWTSHFCEWDATGLELDLGVVVLCPALKRHRECDACGLVDPRENGPTGFWHIDPTLVPWTLSRQGASLVWKAQDMFILGRIWKHFAEG